MSANYQFKIRVGVIVIKDGKLLLARQNNHPFWVLPGGTLEAGEGIGETAAREILEEAGLIVEVIDAIYLGDFIQCPKAESDRIKQTLDVVFLASYKSGSLTMTTDENLNELDFFTLTEARQMHIQPISLVNHLLEDWEQGRFNDNVANVTDLNRVHYNRRFSPVYLGQYS